jgi:WD40 repeat protein
MTGGSSVKQQGVGLVAVALMVAVAGCGGGGPASSGSSSGSSSAGAGTPTATPVVRTPGGAPQRLDSQEPQLVGQVAFGPDGSTLVLVCGDHLELADLAHPDRPNRTVQTGDRPAHVVFAADGRTLASWTDGTPTVRLVDVATGRVVRSLAAKAEPIVGVGLSATGAVVVTEHAAQAFDPSTGLLGRTLVLPFPGTVTVAAVSPDGARLAALDAGTGHDAVHVVSLATGRQESSTPVANADFNPSVAFSPDGASLAVSTGMDSAADTRVVSAATGTVGRTLTGTGASWAAGGQLLTAAAYGEGVTGPVHATVWDAATGEARTTITEDTDRLWVSAISPDGRTVATGRTVVQLWDAATGKAGRTLWSHGGVTRRLAYSPDGSVLAGRGGSSVQWWDAATGAPRAVLAEHTERSYDLSFSADGARLAWVRGALGSPDGAPGAVQFADLSAGRAAGGLAGSPASAQVTFSPDGRTVATSPDGDHLALRDAVTGAVTATLSCNEDDVVSGPGCSAVFSRDGALVAGTGGIGDKVRIWKVATHALVSTLATGGTSYGPAFSPDGRTAATATLGGGAQLWDVATGRALRLLGPRGDQDGDSDMDATAIAFSPDGTLLASGGNDRLIHLWDPVTGAAVRTLVGSTEWISSLVFSPDGKALASSGTDGQVLVWGV